MSGRRDTTQGHIYHHALRIYLHLSHGTTTQKLVVNCSELWMRNVCRVDKVLLHLFENWFCFRLFWLKEHVCTHHLIMWSLIEMDSGIIQSNNCQCLIYSASSFSFRKYSHTANFFSICPINVWTNEAADTCANIWAYETASYSTCTLPMVFTRWLFDNESIIKSYTWTNIQSY